jgi:hypothetical protein
MISYIDKDWKSLIKSVNYSERLLIATTLVKWKCIANEHLQWLENIKEIKEKFENVEFFVSLELDADGLEPFKDLIKIIKDNGGQYWTYSINDNEKTVGSQNRWIRIETGRNLIREYAQRDTWQQNSSEQHLPPNIKYDSILFVDSDMNLNVEIIEKLLEVDHYAVGAFVPGYNLRGRVINSDPKIQEGGATIATLLVRSPQYFDLVFHHNSYLKINDDFTLQKTLERLHGPIWVRRDVVSMHKGRILPVEDRNIEDRKYDTIPIYSANWGV